MRPAGNPSRPAAPPSTVVRRSRAARWAAIAALLAGAVLSSSCAAHSTSGNPAPAADEDDRAEAALGTAADKVLRSERPMYTEKPDLEAYVTTVGARLIEKSNRPRLGYRFSIINASELDAMSVPGGFIYLTRGMLEHLNSEDELAAVLGHEIAHVSERDALTPLPGASSQGEERPPEPASLPDPGDVLALGRMTDFVLAHAERGYAPETEARAAALGVELVKKAGYSPAGADTLRETLARLAAVDPKRVAPYLASHAGMRATGKDSAPPAEPKGARAASAPGRTLIRDPYLEKLDGMPVGIFGKDGFLAGGRYFDRRRLLSVAVPAGWSASLGEGETPVVMRQAPQGYRAGISIRAMTISGGSIEAGRAYARLAPTENLDVIGTTTTASLPAGRAALVELRGPDGRGHEQDIRELFLVRFDQLLVMSFTVPAGEREATQRTFMDLSGSIRFLLPDEVPEHEDARLALYRAQAGDTWESIAAQKAAGAGSGGILAAYNGFGDAQAPAPGLLLKVPPAGALAPQE